MKFVFEELLTDEQRNKTVCVDGAFGSKLQISHWPSNKSPQELKADTSTEMVFNLLESKNSFEYLKDIEIVSNNHFDSDGVLACYALLFPEYSRHHKQLFIDIAATGDFAEFTCEDALRIDRVISDIDDPEKSLFKEEFKLSDEAHVMNNLYLKTFDLLQDLIENTDKYEEQWKEDFEWYRQSQDSFKTQNSVFSNYGDCHLSILESSFILHPVAEVSNAQFDTILSVIKRGRYHLYELKYKPHTWHDTLRPRLIERKSFEPIADKLNLIELSLNGIWDVVGTDPLKDWDYRMGYFDKNFNLVISKNRVIEIEETLFEYFFE